MAIFLSSAAAAGEVAPTLKPIEPRATPRAAPTTMPDIFDWQASLVVDVNVIASPSSLLRAVTVDVSWFCPVTLPCTQRAVRHGIPSDKPRRRRRGLTSAAAGRSYRSSFAPRRK